MCGAVHPQIVLKRSGGFDTALICRKIGLHQDLKFTRYITIASIVVRQLEGAYFGRYNVCKYNSITNEDISRDG